MPALLYTHPPKSVNPLYTNMPDDSGILVAGYML